METKKWMRLLIEKYTPGKYEGRWVVTNGEIGLDLNYLKSCVRSLRNDDRYRGATLQFIEDGEDIVIGAFCGFEPPSTIKRGVLIPPEMFEPES